MTWLDFAVRGTVILAVAFLVTRAMRGASASARHFVWTAGFGTLLLLPLAMNLGPRFAVGAIPAPVRATTPASAHAARASAPVPAIPAAPRRPASFYLEGLYGLGLLLVMRRFAASAWRMRGVVRRASPAPYAVEAARNTGAKLGIPALRALETREVPVPMIWGIRNPVVLLPAAAREWPRCRLQVVLLHEMVHVARHDLLAQIAAQAACCLYWFHPLVWVAARRLRAERERACDDAVLIGGISAPDYAGHLMELARVLVERQASLADAPAMAETGDLEERVRALLDRGRNRAPLSRRAAVAVAALACAVVLPLATVTSYAQAGRGALAGIVKDPSGSRVPRAEITIKNLDGKNEEMATADAAGEYGFPSIPAGHYSIEARAPGFKLATSETVVGAGAASQADINLAIGNINERVQVHGTRTSPAPVTARAMGAPQRVPIGGNVQFAQVLYKVNPEYPADLKQQGITGTVVIRAIISKTGDVMNAQVVNTVHPGLAQAALDAFKQWRHKPTLLNGEPVEVATTVTMSFDLDQ
jgi:TonB family protein